MKKILIVLLILAVLGVGAYLILKSSDQNTNWQTYSNARYEFSVDYPDDWTLSDAPANNDGREFISPDNEISCRAYGFQNALINEQGDPQTLDEFIDWFVENLDIEEVLERNSTTLDNIDARELVTKTEGVVARAIYTLGEETGHGLVCYYPNEKIMKEQDKNFTVMKESFTSTASTVNTGNNSCANLLSGVIIPFKDFQTFDDTKYTGVTTTSREHWDKKLLPEKVVSLEDKGYSCSPLPLEFDGGSEEGGVMPEPMVTKVQWDCELEYEAYEYVGNEESGEKANLEKQGYSCTSEPCTDGQTNNESTVWLCAK